MDHFSEVSSQKMKNEKLSPGLYVFPDVAETPSRGVNIDITIDAGVIVGSCNLRKRFRKRHISGPTNRMVF